MKKFIIKLYNKYFGFEEGIDITDECQLLVRRNIVIKNIILVSNLLYSVLFLVLSIYTNTSTNWLFTVLTFGITYPINRLLKRLINLDKNDKTKQKIATYIASFYMFLSVILVYIKVYNIESFTVGGYILIYYALMVISLYQDKRLLLECFGSLLAGITIIHFTCTYPIYNEGYTFVSFFKMFFTESKFGDIVLRTVIFIVYYFVLYAIVSIGNYMQQERIKELSKRKEVQEDFASIVKNLFGVVLYNGLWNNEVKIKQVSTIAMQLARYYGYNEKSLQELQNFSLSVLEFQKIYDLLNINPSLFVKEYDLIKAQTEVGSMIAKRLQLSQKCEIIVRKHEEGAQNESFTADMKKMQGDISSQIILLSDLYITLRNAQTYKRPLSHSQTIKLFNEQFNIYFEYDLKERFLSFEHEFEKTYNNF
ncbi:MAG: hypothetical protein LBV51_02155 [Acholeplasmatales bacterium]|jgi:CRISPR/Cas system CMR-associated protein Cmr5 small subunit|nr:hypothetical protein [Acholeplasmatales bacterium]